MPRDSTIVKATTSGIINGTLAITVTAVTSSTVAGITTGVVRTSRLKQSRPDRAAFLYAAAHYATVTVNADQSYCNPVTHPDGEPIMIKTSQIVLLLGAMTTASAFAQDLSPGLWEISMESRVPNDAGWAPSPFNLTQCLTANDAKDPSKLIGSLSTPGATGCNYTEKSYSGNTFRFALQCAGTFGLKTSGIVNFSGDSFDGNITANAGAGGKPIVMQNHVSGKRVGGC